MALVNPTDCGNCRHWKPWTDEDWEKYWQSCGMNGAERPELDNRVGHRIGWCDKIPKGKIFCEEGYKFDGDPYDSENYDEDMHCFEPIESEEKENA